MIESGLIIYWERSGDYYYGELELRDDALFGPGTSEEHIIELPTSLYERVGGSTSNDKAIEVQDGVYALNVFKIDDDIKAQGTYIRSNMGNESALVTFKSDGSSSYSHVNSDMEKTYLSFPKRDSLSSLAKYKHLTFDAYPSPNRPAGFNSSAQAAAAYANYWDRNVAFNYQLGFTLNGLPNINYSIDSITGAGSEFIETEAGEITRKGLYIFIDNMDIEDVRRSQHFYYDYKLKVNGTTIKDKAPNAENVRKNGIGDYGNNTSGNITGRVYVLDPNVFTPLKGAVNVPKLTFNVEYTIYIRVRSTNEIVDSNTISYSFNLEDYSLTYTNHIVDVATGLTNINGYIGDTSDIKLKINTSTINSMFKKFAYSTSLETVNGTGSAGELIHKIGLRDPNSVNKTLADYLPLASNIGTHFRLTTNITTAINTWNIHTEEIAYIKNAYWDLSHVSLSLSGADSASNPISYDYITSNNDPQKADSALPKDIKFFSDGTVTVNASFKLSKQTRLIDGDGNVSFNQRPSDVYFIAVAKNNLYKYNGIPLAYFDYRGVRVNELRDSFELNYFSNASNKYAETFLSKLTDSWVYYSHITDTVETLPASFTSKTYNMSLDLEDRGEYSFYIIAYNENVGYVSHCLSNTQAPNTADDAHFDIPWRNK